MPEVGSDVFYPGRFDRWTADQISTMVRNRFSSELVNSARPRKWLPHLSDYAAGPLDRYGKLITREGNATNRAERDEQQTHDAIANAARRFVATRLAKLMAWARAMSLKQPLTDAQADVHMEEWALIAEAVGFDAFSAAVREVMRNDSDWFPSVKVIRERAGLNRADRLATARKNERNPEIGVAVTQRLKLERCHNDA